MCRFPRQGLPRLRRRRGRGLRPGCSGGHRGHAGAGRPGPRDKRVGRRATRSRQGPVGRPDATAPQRTR
eukprot:4930247-Pleurochrysis_carterae.AAC.1